MTDTHAASGVLMTPAEIRSRVAGLLTVCTSAADGSMAHPDAFGQARVLLDDLRTMHFTLEGIDQSHHEAVLGAVHSALGAAEARLLQVVDAFMQAFTELAMAHAQVTGGGEDAADIVQHLALYWAAQQPPATEEPSPTR